MKQDVCVLEVICATAGQWGKPVRQLPPQPGSSEPVTKGPNNGTKFITNGRNPEHRGAKIFSKFGSTAMLC
jgi:hypothetical protein